MDKSFIKAISISVFLHLLIVAYFVAVPFKLTVQQPNYAKTKVIDSYVYRAPNANPSLVAKPSVISKENTKPPITKDDNRSAESTEKSKLVTDTYTDTFTDTNKITKNTTLLRSNEKTSENAPTKQLNSAVFNSQRALAEYNQKLDQQMFDDILKQHNNQGFSAMQTLPPAVSHRVVTKTTLQKRQEATTIVGNESFIKLNGVCQQTSDLSFIDDNLGKVTSFSDCGETDDEKYFRVFMKTKMKK